MHVIKARSTHAGRLERWLGAAEVDRISSAMRGWYGPPILVANVPSARGIRVGADGDFVGTVDGGGFANLADRCIERFNRALNKVARRTPMAAGFSSLSDLISEATAAGKKQDLYFQKVGTTGVVGVTNSLWGVGNLPAAGTSPSAAPGGNATAKSTTGALYFTNPAGGDTTHLVRGDTTSSVAANTLLLYDRLFHVSKTMASTATEAVTGVPTRYQSTTPGAVDSAEGNFLFIETRTALAATAHDWNTCTYLDQGNAAGTMPLLTGNASAIVNRLDHPVGQWFAPLATGDTGIKALTQMQCNASIATGTINFVIGHPIAFLPMPVANMMTIYDGINTAFNLARIFDDACLAFLEITKPATTATTYSGGITVCAG
jgi:hypothetical protein